MNNTLFVVKSLYQEKTINSKKKKVLRQYFWNEFKRYINVFMGIGRVKIFIYEEKKLDKIGKWSASMVIHS